jgi:hypothetical protein
MAWHSEIHEQKDHTGDLQIGHAKGHGSVLNVSSSRDKVDELWSMLRYDVLLDESTDSNLGLRGAKTKAQKVHAKSEISAYIDQAENFYSFARKSDYRSAPLLYYYSFLNLAKALIVQKKPALVDKTFRHGLHRKTKSGKLIDRSFQVQQSSANQISVFNEIYNLEYESYLPSNRSISFYNTLGYVTDIGSETDKLLKRASRKVHPTKVYCLLNNKTNKCWTVLVTPNGFYPNNYKSAFGGFEKDFQRFNPGALSLQFSFDMTNNQSKNFNFSQSIAEYDVLPSGSIALWETKKHIEDTIGHFSQDYIYDDSFSFCITDPIRKNWQAPFNEPLAIYSMMFYLSEVVRYSPGEFNNNFAPNNKEGWLIKNFIESSPYACLVYLASKMTGRTYVIKSR